jgi:hypothetical protein
VGEVQMTAKACIFKVCLLTLYVDTMPWNISTEHQTSGSSKQLAHVLSKTRKNPNLSISSIL